MNRFHLWLQITLFQKYHDANNVLFYIFYQSKKFLFIGMLEMLCNIGILPFLFIAIFIGVAELQGKTNVKNDGKHLGKFKTFSLVR